MRYALLTLFLVSLTPLALLAGMYLCTLGLSIFTLPLLPLFTLTLATITAIKGEHHV